MITNTKRQVEYIARYRLKGLFRVTEGYHRRKLFESFRKHYRPNMKDEEWTLNLSDQCLNDLRLHLRWELHRDTTKWDRVELGMQILKRLRTTGVLIFLKKIIRDKLNNVTYPKH